MAEAAAITGDEGDAQARASNAKAGCPEDPCVAVPASVLAVALAWMAVLVACFFLYERDAAFAHFVAFKLGPLPFEAIWFGAVGGFLISAQGIFEHNREWKRSYDYWHYARPLLGALMGTLGCLVFIVLNEAATKKTVAVNPVFYDVIALAIGYREESFRTLIAKLFDTIILPGKDESKTDENGGAATGAAGGGDKPKTPPAPDAGEPAPQTQQKPPGGGVQKLVRGLLPSAIAVWALMRSGRATSRRPARMRR